MPKALICGISGQDGSYLAAHLLQSGYEVWGTSRDAQQSRFEGLKRLGIHDRVRFESMAPNDFRSVLSVVSSCEPDEIYNLSGQSSVGLSFVQPVETLESILNATVNLLEAVKFLDPKIRFYNACSSECFGNTAEGRADEQTPFRPRSPYGVAKAAAFWQLANYRDSYGLFACSGILFNHESPLRPERFVTSKIVRAARRIADGSDENLVLGNVCVSRDWGWAPEYVEAMHLMLRAEQPSDYVVATGVTSSLGEFLEAVFRSVGLDWRAHVTYNDELRRPSDISANRADPSQIARCLGWNARVNLQELARKLVREELY
jgi:GDPmannose 4,6-dehydratase